MDQAKLMNTDVMKQENAVPLYDMKGGKESSENARLIEFLKLQRDYDSKQFYKIQILVYIYAIVLYFGVNLAMLILNTRRQDYIENVSVPEFFSSCVSCKQIFFFAELLDRIPPDRILVRLWIHSPGSFHSDLERDSGSGEEISEHSGVHHPLHQHRAHTRGGHHPFRLQAVGGDLPLHGVWRSGGHHQRQLDLCDSCKEEVLRKRRWAVLQDQRLLRGMCDAPLHFQHHGLRRRFQRRNRSREGWPFLRVHH